MKELDHCDDYSSDRHHYRARTANSSVSQYHSSSKSKRCRDTEPVGDRSKSAHFAIPLISPSALASAPRARFSRASTLVVTVGLMRFSTGEVMLPLAPIEGTMLPAPAATVPAATSTAEVASAIVSTPTIVIPVAQVSGLIIRARARISSVVSPVTTPTTGLALDALTSSVITSRTDPRKSRMAALLLSSRLSLRSALGCPRGRPLLVVDDEPAGGNVGTVEGGCNG